MKKSFYLLAIIVFAGQFCLKAQDLEKILDKHFEVVGQEKLLDVETIVASGKVVQMGMELPMKLYQKRPNKVRMEAEIQGSQFVQAFDGENGWTVMPWTGSMEPQDMNEQQLKGVREMSEMDGDLYNWEDKGFTLTYEGEDEMEGTPVYKLKLIKEDGNEYIYYLDADNYVILKTDAKVEVQGTEVETSSYFSNFKPVKGMVMPFSIESRMNGQVTAQIVIDEYEVNSEIDDTLFEKPEISVD